MRRGRGRGPQLRLTGGAKACGSSPLLFLFGPFVAWLLIASSSIDPNRLALCRLGFRYIYKL